LQEVKKCPTLNVGIHLVLTWGKPLRNDLPSLVNDSGYFKFTSTLDEVPNAKDVKREWKAQIEAFITTSVTLSHIDSHHHVHGCEHLKDVIIELAKEYLEPVRYVDSLKNYPEYLLTEALSTGFYADGVHNDIFRDLEKLDARTVEVMTHPAYIRPEFSQARPYMLKRSDQLN